MVSFFFYDITYDDLCKSADPPIKALPGISPVKSSTVKSNIQ